MKKMGFIILLLALFALNCSGPSPNAPTMASTVLSDYLTLSPSPELPILEDGTILTPGDNQTFSIGVSDEDGDILQYSARNLPPGAAFDPATKMFTWTPAIGQAGIYPGVRFYVTDGELGDSESITITVPSSNHVPVLPPIALKVVNVNTLITFTLHGSDQEGDTLTYSAKNLPPGAIFDPPSFTWLPTQVGVWPAICFIVSDGKARVTQQAIIVVR